MLNAYSSAQVRLVFIRRFLEISENRESKEEKKEVKKILNKLLDENKSDYEAFIDVMTQIQVGSMGTFFVSLLHMKDFWDTLIKECVAILQKITSDSFASENEWNQYQSSSLLKNIMNKYNNLVPAEEVEVCKKTVSSKLI